MSEMSKVKKTLIVLFVVFIAIQFIHPASNSSKSVQRDDILSHFDIPPKVADILKTSCYDCHSNNTRYPWYVNIQPLGWFLASHVKNGKEDLNFNEFASYPKRRQLSKFKSIRNSIKDGSMPLASYTLLHKDAKLSEDNKSLLILWTTIVIDSLSQQ